MGGSVSESSVPIFLNVVKDLFTGVNGREGQVLFGPRRLKIHATYPEAPLSPFFINLRVEENGGTMTENQVHEIGTLMTERFFQLYPKKEGHPDFLCGLPKAGEPFVGVMSELTGIPVLKLVKQGTGDDRRIVASEDILPGKGKSVLVVDDLITNARSKLEGVGALRDADYLVTDVLVFLNRGGEECVAELVRYKLRLSYVLDLQELFDTLYTLCLITGEQLDECLAYKDELDAFVATHS